MMDGNFPSLADISAVTKNNDDWGGGSWSWLIIILFLFMFGNGSWGGNRGAEQYATSNEVQRGFDNQNVMMRFDTIGQNINNSAYENAQLINNVNTNMLQTTANVTNAMNQGFDSVTMQINNLAHQMESCCCNLKTQMLQDKYDALLNEYNLSNLASANAVQTQNLLGNLGRWVSNPPVSQYYPYGTTIS